MNDRPPSTTAGIALRKLALTKGRHFWRGLEELAQTESFEKFLQEEFPGLQGRSAAFSRRSLLKIMGASLALAGLSACKGEGDEAAFPYVNAPDGVTIGQAKWYATAVTFAGYAQPVLGKTFTGRPVKLEGNPDHPASKGATDAFTQAALLGLYDPGRSQSPRHLGMPADWGAFDAEMSANAAVLDEVKGEGFRLLTGPASSPTLLRQINAMMLRWPKARWHVCDPVAEDLQLVAAKMVFSRSLQIDPMLDAAETIVSVDCDFLGPGPRQTFNALRFGQRRRLRQVGQGECRLFAAEPTPSLTGVAADARLATSFSATARLVHAIAARLGLSDLADSELTDKEQRWIEAATAALRRSKEHALLLVGSHHDPDVQALGLLVNERLGSFGTALRFFDPVLAMPPDGAQSLKSLTDDMHAGRVSTLAIVGTDPAYMAPADLNFRDALRKVRLNIHAGLQVDETASFCRWHAPLQHDLESWSDARAVDGSVSIIQPLVRPFYDVRSVHGLIESLMGRSASDHELVQLTWQSAWGDGFDQRWRDSLHRGFVDASAPQPFVPPVVNRNVAPFKRETDKGLDLVIRPDAGVWDGSFSENAWAQETPRPLSKITWGNAILISPQLAGERALNNGDEIRVTAGATSVTGPVWIMPGQEKLTVVATLGYGSRVEDSIAAGLGYDAYSLRRSGTPWHIGAVAIEATGKRSALASTQLHQSIDGFDFVRSVDVRELAVSPQVDKKSEPPSFYPGTPKSDPSWGMSIDLDLCIGCNACVTACQAENNIPVVGKDLIAEGRQMHWLRIDHYYEGDVAEPKSFFQPVPCMHCEQAPCEMGCPVNAAVHSIDGLNLQVYNRCIGTRTCSSYCPYKVRRFNWFDFTGNDPEPVKAMRNPDVTVRSRGVMEKCTYCVQRIAEARIAADKEGRPIRDREILTACQQACPTQAIVFGNVADPNSEVSRRKAGLRDFALLEEANTRPRTTYLARIEEGDLLKEETSG